MKKNTFLVVILILTSLVLVACGSSAEPEAVTDEIAVEVTAEVEEPILDYWELQWVEISLLEEGTVVLINDLDQEMTILTIVVEVDGDLTRYRVEENGRRECEATVHIGGGKSALKEGYADCSTDLNAKLYGDWHLGSGTTVEASTVYAIFIPLDEATENQTVNVFGPNGQTAFVIKNHADGTLTASVGEDQICEVTHDGTISRTDHQLGAYCESGFDGYGNDGYGIVIFGNHASVEIDK